MRAVLMTRPGGPEVLTPARVAEPELTRPTQVKVALAAAGVNPVDTKIRRRGLLAGDAYPAILGCDGAGEVVEVGAAVSHLERGDRVWFCNGGLGADPGTYGEFAVVEGDVARPMPRSVDFATAAAAPLVLITAWGALYDRARLGEGQTVLIHAGAGGVGHVAVQLARLRGARVITTVGDHAKGGFAASLGAERAVFHRQEDFVAAVNDWTGGMGANVVFDTVGGEVCSRSVAATAHFGDLVTLLDAPPDMPWKEVRVRNLRVGFELMLTPMLRDLPAARAHHGEILDRCAGLMDAGQLTVHVSRRFHLEEAGAAHRLVEAGHMQGKAVLDIAGES